MTKGQCDLQLMSVLVGYLATAGRAVCIADADSFIVYANPAMANLFGAPSYENIVGKNICDFIEVGVDHPHNENALQWMDRIKGDFKETGRVVCRDYNDNKILVDVHHRRFFMVPKIGGGEALYMGCTVTKAEGSE